MNLSDNSLSHTPGLGCNSLWPVWHLITIRVDSCLLLIHHRSHNSLLACLHIKSLWKPMKSLWTKAIAFFDKDKQNRHISFWWTPSFHPPDVCCSWPVEENKKIEKEKQIQLIFLEFNVLFVEADCLKLSVISRYRYQLLCITKWLNWALIHISFICHKHIFFLSLLVGL